MFSHTCLCFLISASFLATAASMPTYQLRLQVCFRKQITFNYAYQKNSRRALCSGPGLPAIQCVRQFLIKKNTIPCSDVHRLCIIKYCARKQTISFHKARHMVFVCARYIFLPRYTYTGVGIRSQEIGSNACRHSITTHFNYT